MSLVQGVSWPCSETFKSSGLVFATRDDADLTGFEATKRLFEKVQPTHVIHLAAAVGGIGGNSIHSGEYFKNNIMMNLNVLELAREFKVKKLFHLCQLVYSR